MRRHATLIIGLPLLVACSGPEAESASQTQLQGSNQLDHVMVGIANLDSGIAILEQMTGITAIHGGVHPGRDTRNALLSLGDDVYFELIAPQADLETVTDPIAEATLSLNTPTPMHWAIATTDIEATRNVVRAAGWNTTEVDARSRETPDGRVLSWRIFFITDDPDAASIPFFIEWGPDSTHPSQTSPVGCELTEFIAHSPTAERLSQLLDALGLELEARASSDDWLRIVLDCAGNPVTFGQHRIPQ